ncbi:MAG: LemA family protein [Planctomycetes bacterium]|nr:LemA family protein [Planctomycetota bacterium]
MTGLIVVIVIFVVLLLVFVTIYNGLIRLRNEADNSWAQIDVQLKRRHDLIPNLVEVVKDYMSYEKETLEAVIKARSAAVDASGKGVATQAKAEGELSGVLGRLFALFENYPDLKANQNVSQLQEELTSTENKIGFARQHYNDCVMRFNTKCEVVPSNIVAGMCGFQKKEFFEIEEEEKEVPKVDLR